MTFADWLQKQLSRSDDVGDLAEEAFQEEGAPEGRSTFGVWEAYFPSRGATGDTLISLAKAWDQYSSGPEARPASDHL
jgi:uncharacterized protein YozE (UPF0346 family)